MHIPDTVRDFIDTLRPVKKSSTCKTYLYSLNGFHVWLAQQTVALGTIDRNVTERWLKFLVDRGFAPETRWGRICRVRIYLEWLYDKRMVAIPADELIRTSDLPKIPDTLPKPFSKEADRKLQHGFLTSNTIYGQALFLMRHSGVRIGELIDLDFHCLEIDLHGNAFLKVPLGKLDNERLVPLDDETSRIVVQLQKQCPSDASFLIAPHFSRGTAKNHVRTSLRKISMGLDIPGPVIPHRLRHTYASELLNAGMSLFAIMKLLGHRDITMTMRYAALTQNTVTKDYHRAMKQIMAKYDLPLKTIPICKPDPERMLLDTISWLRNNSPEDNNTHRLIKRLYKLNNEIALLSK